MSPRAEKQKNIIFFDYMGKLRTFLDYQTQVLNKYAVGIVIIIFIFYSEETGRLILRRATPRLALV